MNLQEIKVPIDKIGEKGRKSCGMSAVRGDNRSLTSIDGGISGWTESYAKTGPLIKVYINKSHHRKGLKLLSNHNTTSLDKSRPKLSFKAKCLKKAQYKSTDFNEIKLSRVKYPQTNYTFIRKKSISQLEILMRMLSRSTDCAPKRPTAKSSSRQLPKLHAPQSISPIFSLNQSPNLPKALTTLYKYPFIPNKC